MYIDVEDQAYRSLFRIELTNGILPPVGSQIIYDSRPYEVCFYRFTALDTRIPEIKKMSGKIVMVVK